MTMHLLPPMYSTTGKKRGKNKHRTADAAAKSRRNQESWQQLMEKWDVKPNKMVVAKSKPNRSNNSQSMVSSRNNWRDRVDPRRLTDHIPSVDTATGIAAKKESPQYSGDAMLGISSTHKSNDIPIFNTTHIEEISKMRR